MAEADASATHPEHGQTNPTVTSDNSGGKLIDPIDRYTALAVRVSVSKLFSPKNRKVFSGSNCRSRSRWGYHLFEKLEIGKSLQKYFTKKTVIFVQFHKFQHVSQIPKDFIRKELELKGRVREVLPSGELRVEHEPIMKIPFLPKRKNATPGLLNLRLAGVELSQSGQQFLAKDLRLTNKPVTFTVIKVRNLFFKFQIKRKSI